MAADSTFWEWRQQAVAGNVERRELSIALLDESGTPRVRWKVSKVWPSKWSGEETAINELELSCERIEVETWA